MQVLLTPDSPREQLLCEPLDHFMYSLANKSSWSYDESTHSVANWAKRLQVLMKSYMSDSFDSISMIRFG